MLYNNTSKIFYNKYLFTTFILEREKLDINKPPEIFEYDFKLLVISELILLKLDAQVSKNWSAFL